MGRMIGKRQGAISPKMEKAQREALALGRQTRKVRVLGKLASPEKVKTLLEEWLPENLDAIRALARASRDDRVKLDARKYLVDRRMGRPTERQQIEQLPVTYQAPSDTQFRELAGRIRGDAEKGPNGESGADPDGDSVVADPVAVTQ